MEKLEHQAQEYKVQRLKIDVFEDMIDKKYYLQIFDTRKRMMSNLVELDSDGLINIGKLLNE